MEAEERQEREGNETMMVIKPTNTSIPLRNRWGARHWSNCCQPAARRVTSCFTKASNEHKKILNPRPARVKGLGTGGLERRSEQSLRRNITGLAAAPGCPTKAGDDGLWEGTSGACLSC